MVRFRRDPIGVHFFCRDTGLNVLFDEAKVVPSEWSIAPRHVSIALGNACDFKCPYCYAPKNAGRIEAHQAIEWAEELDRLDCLGVGFGGGEPTLHKDLAVICREISVRTALSISLTTHGHHFDRNLSDALAGHVHMIRVSMDGLHDVYEANRGHSFAKLQARIPIIRDTARFGVNYLVNASTVAGLTQAAEFAFSEGASELLLLPEVGPGGRLDLNEAVLDRFEEWISENHGIFRLAISEIGTRGVSGPWLPIRQDEHPCRELMHIDAAGGLRPDAFSERSVRISDFDTLAKAITALRGQIPTNH